MVGGQRQQIVASRRDYLSPTGTLTLSLRDERGQPVAGRVMLLAHDGRYYGPSDGWLHGDDSFDRAQQKQENRYFHCQDRCSVDDARGKCEAVGDERIRAPAGAAGRRRDAVRSRTDDHASAPAASRAVRCLHQRRPARAHELRRHLSPAPRGARGAGASRGSRCGLQPDRQQGTAHSRHQRIHD